jgi:hypothetical protein
MLISSSRLTYPLITISREQQRRGRRALRDPDTPDDDSD